MAVFFRLEFSELRKGKVYSANFSSRVQIPTLRHIDTKGGTSLGVPFFVLETSIARSRSRQIKQKVSQIDWRRLGHNILLFGASGLGKNQMPDKLVDVYI